MRAAGLVGKVLAIVLLRDAGVGPFAAASICIVAVQLAGQLDLGVGAVAFDLGARRHAPQDVVALVRQQIQETRRRRVLLLASSNLAILVLYLQLDVRVPAVLLCGLVVVQFGSMWLAVVLGPYERAMAGMQKLRVPALGAVVGVLLAGFLAIGVLAFDRGAVGLVAPILVALPSAGARLASWRSLRSLSDSTLARGQAPDWLRRHFSILQFVGIASFGGDQLLAALGGQSGNYVAFIAHARYFEIGAGLFSVMIVSVRPMTIRVLHELGPRQCRRMYWWVLCGTAALAGLACAPVFVEGGPVRLVRASMDVNLSLAIPMSVWFVMLQAGSVNGQVLAALRDTGFQVRQGLIMAQANVVLSVSLTLVYGPIGVIYGSLIAYTAIVAVPSFYRLTALSCWERGVQTMGEGVPEVRRDG